MKAFFPSDALLGRNGGDEFCILYQIVPLQKQIYSCRNFTKLPKSFSYHGKGTCILYFSRICRISNICIQSFTNSCAADAALYEIKLHGKNGCRVYREGTSGQVPANNLDSHSRISLNIFQVHSSYTELTKKMMNYFLQMMNFFICPDIKI